MTIAYRTGRAYEDASKLPDAVAAYEKALTLPYQPPDLPDPEETTSAYAMMAQAAVPIARFHTAAAGPTGFRAEIVGRLQRLYGALGRPDKVFEITIKSYEVNPTLLGNLASLEQLEPQAKAIGREETLRNWLRQQFDSAKDPLIRANIQWLLKDYKACAASVAVAWKQKSASRSMMLEPWYDRFRRVGTAELRGLLTAIVEVDPGNAKARLQLLDTLDRFEGADVIATLESLLETDAAFAFARGKGDYNRTRFRNYFDLAYRLMRLYERQKQVEKLRALGLRIAAGEKPFGPWWNPDASRPSLPDSNGLEEDVNGCLALLIEQADRQTLDKLESLWQQRGDFPARRQLARRRAGALVATTVVKDIGWANLPQGVRLIAATDTVLSLAHDEKHVYAGLPWGVAVYDPQGEPLTRIALGEAASALAVIGDKLWVGTPKGLFRVDTNQWQVAHLWLHGDVPNANRHSRSFPGPADYWFDNGVYTLAADGDDLWIGLHRNIQRLDTRTLQLRAYSCREMKVDRGTSFSILPDGQYVWASSADAGTRRYDRATDTWAKVEYAERPLGGSTANLLVLRDGTQVVGKARTYAPRYQYPREDWPFRALVWDTRESEGGLEWSARTGVGVLRGVGSAGRKEPAGDVILGDTVFAAVPDPERRQLWLCTNLGLAVLNDHDRVVAHFTRRDGLCGNRITSGVDVNGELYFSTGWGDHGGGLLKADPATGVFTAFFQTDGLATDKLARIEESGQRLRLVYDVEYGRATSQYRYRLFPPGEFDPATRDVSSAGPAKHLQQKEAATIVSERSGQADRPMPCLGGFVISKFKLGEKTYLCGTRGLVILTGQIDPAMPAVELKPQVISDPYVGLEQEASRMTIHVGSPDDLAKYAKDANPFVRHRALFLARWYLTTKSAAACVPLLKSMVADTYTPNRCLVIEMLGLSHDRTALPLVVPALEDPDKDVREAAAIAMASLGKLPPLDHFEEMLAEANHNTSRSSVIYKVLAPYGTPKVFSLLMRFPLNVEDDERCQDAFRELGRTLRTHPELAEVLLQVCTQPQDPGPDSNFGPARFAQEIFKHAGKSLLPTLQKALRSKDRVVRSNAARACGAIGDSAAAPHLLEALDLESGLSRASVVWALGELRAKEALPRLVSLYDDARNDERRGASSGFRIAQFQAQVQSQYQAISRFEAIAADWDELKLATVPQPIDPRRNERLLTPRDILEALGKIGPEWSQPFYRKLAADADSTSRHEAAQRLAVCGKDDAALNLPVLRTLHGDSDARVRAAAAVSLLILGQTDVEKEIVAWLDSLPLAGGIVAVAELERVKDRKKLRFARAAITRLSERCASNQHQSRPVQWLLKSIPQ